MGFGDEEFDAAIAAVLAEDKELLQGLARV